MNLAEQIIEQGKGPTIEFIREPENFSRIAESVVALLNSDGGYVVIGIDESNQIESIPNSETVLSDLKAYLINNIAPKAYLDAGIDDVDGKRIIIIDVPKGKDTPFITNDRVFLRIGSATQEASANTMHSILQKRVAEVERWERRPSPTLTENDFASRELSLSINKVRELAKDNITELSDRMALFSILGMVSRGQFTNAADVCLGLNPAIRHPQVRVRIFAFQTNRGGDFIAQQTLSGPLAEVILKSIAFIQERAPLSAEFQENRVIRTDRHIYPLLVLREGLVNAFAHRDYASFSGGVTIEVYPTRVEIWNSGKLPKGWDAKKLRTPHPSLPSNPDIAQFLYIRGYMERIGRGTLKMIQVCQEEGIPSPNWKVDSDGVKLTLHSRASNTAPTANLNERQLMLLNTLAIGEAITFKRYSTDFAAAVGERQAHRDLVALVEADLLRQEGKGPATRYKRTTRRVDVS